MGFLSAGVTTLLMLAIAIPPVISVQTYGSTLYMLAKLNEEAIIPCPKTYADQALNWKKTTPTGVEELTTAVKYLVIRNFLATDAGLYECSYVNSNQVTITSSFYVITAKDNQENEKLARMYVENSDEDVCYSGTDLISITNRRSDVQLKLSIDQLGIKLNTVYIYYVSNHRVTGDANIKNVDIFIEEFSVRIYGPALTTAFDLIFEEVDNPNSRIEFNGLRFQRMERARLFKYTSTVVWTELQENHNLVCQHHLDLLALQAHLLVPFDESNYESKIIHAHSDPQECIAETHQLRDVEYYDKMEAKINLYRNKPDVPNLPHTIEYTFPVVFPLSNSPIFIVMSEKTIRLKLNCLPRVNGAGCVWKYYQNGDGSDPITLTDKTTLVTSDIIPDKFGHYQCHCSWSHHGGGGSDNQEIYLKPEFKSLRRSDNLLPMYVDRTEPDENNQAVKSSIFAHYRHRVEYDFDLGKTLLRLTPGLRYTVETTEVYVGEDNPVKHTAIDIDKMSVQFYGAAITTKVVVKFLYLQKHSIGFEHDGSIAQPVRSTIEDYNAVISDVLIFQRYRFHDEIFADSEVTTTVNRTSQSVESMLNDADCASKLNTEVLRSLKETDYLDSLDYEIIKKIVHEDDQSVKVECRCRTTSARNQEYYDLIMFNYNFH